MASLPVVEDFEVFEDSVGQLDAGAPSATWERTSVSRAIQRRANALSECFAEAVGLFIVEIRKRAQRLMSARLDSPSRDSRNSAGAFTTSALRVVIAEVRPLQPVSLATLTWRIISTSPSAVLGIAVEIPPRTDRAAASASIASDLPLLRRDRRSPRFTSTTRCPHRLR